MQFFKKLFTSNPPASKDRGYYVYVQPKMCKEIIRVRVDTMNDLSQTDDNKGYYVRKVASATRCPFQVEIELYFDADRRLKNQDIHNGTFVTEKDYWTYLAAQATPTE